LKNVTLTNKIKHSLPEIERKRCVVVGCWVTGRALIIWDMLLSSILESESSWIVVFNEDFFLLVVFGFIGTCPIPVSIVSISSTTLSLETMLEAGKKSLTCWFLCRWVCILFYSFLLIFDFRTIQYDHKKEYDHKKYFFWIRSITLIFSVHGFLKCI
jgi:hypothetical protein